MGFWEGAGGALLGAGVGGWATYLGQARLERRRREADTVARREVIEDERAAAREATSQSASVDVLEALWQLSDALPVLWLLATRLSLRAGSGDDALRAEAAMDRIKRAEAVDGPLLVPSALRQQLKEVAVLASEYAYGEWHKVGLPDDAAEAQNVRQARFNGGGVDTERFVAWTRKMFEAYVDGSWSAWSVEPRPALARPDVGSWMPPDERLSGPDSP